jgi:hypothetical protein
MGYSSVSEIMAEISRLVPGYKISNENIQNSEAGFKGRIYSNSNVTFINDIKVASKV